MSGLESLSLGKSVQGARALPVLNLVNQASNACVSTFDNGERGCSVKKGCAYLGYRVLTYSGLPAIANLISLVVSGILCVLTLCHQDANAWCKERFYGSFYNLAKFFLTDIPYDFVSLFNCCCPCRNSQEEPIFE